MNPFFFLLPILFVACQSTTPSQTEKRTDGTTAFTGEAMTMQYKILIGQTITSFQSHQIAEIIRKTFEETDTVFNKWNPHSELSQLNQQKAGIATPLSSSLWRLFNETDRIVVLSEGKFDPTIEPIQTLWKQKLKVGTVPLQEEIEALAQAIGWNKISFVNGVFKKEYDQTQLDFGGIAKGLCIDLLIERLNEYGITHLFVEWGGEIRACGSHPQGRLWTIFISRLGDSDPGKALSILDLKDQAIATSGDYLQNWTLRLPDSDGRKKTTTLFHIFDPKTLQPIEANYTSVASASVIASSCALADGLATTAMMFPSCSEAMQWADTIKKQLPDLSFWIISRSDLETTKLNVNQNEI